MVVGWGVIGGVVDLGVDLVGLADLVVDLVGFEVVGLVVLIALVEGDLALVVVDLVVRVLVVLVVFVVDLGVDFLTVEEVVVFLRRRGARPSIDLFLSIVYNYTIMAIKLTKKQLALLEFLEDFTEAQGYSPSYREIMAGMGLTSVSAVAEHVDNLVSKGVLRKVPGAARSLEILDYKHEETVKLFKERMATCTEEEKKVLEQAGEILGLDLME